MKKILLTSIYVLTFCLFSYGQNSNCPTISIKGPSQEILTNSEMYFTAEVSGVEANKIGYKWIVSDNRPFTGQGKNRIVVDVKSLYDNAIKATVEISNLSEGCPNSASETGIIACNCTPLILDEFGKIPFKDQKARLALIREELDKRPEFIAYIILYHPAKDNNKLDRRVRQIKNFLINESKIPEEKLHIVFGAEEPEERTRIYLVPLGAEPPTP